MKRFSLFFISLFLLASCVSQSNRNSEDTSSNRINRDGCIAFMGLRLGLINDSVNNFLQEDEDFIVRDFPDLYERSGHNTFNDLDENEVCTFYCTIIDANDNSHGGWGKVKSDADSVTTIYCYVPVESKNDSVYERLLPLFKERYGDPDEEYETGFEVKQIGSEYKIVYNDDVETNLYDRGCYWDFANNQRIYLNDVVYLGSKYGGVFSDHLRVEIVYRDMNSVYRKEEAEKEKQQQEYQANKKAEEDRVKENKKRRAGQQL